MSYWKYIFVGLLLNLFHVPVKAQVVLERFVLAPFALSGSTALGSFYSTAGQEASLTHAQANFVFTEGFQQPLDLPALQVEINAYLDNCTNEYVAEIVQVEGCASIEDVVFTWNGISNGVSYRGNDSVVQVTALSALGCYFEETILFEELPLAQVPCDLLFYNMITPNGDGSNDTWVIENIELEDYITNDVSIFNRWGQIVWKGSNYNNADVIFSGKSSSGEVLSDGTYFFEFRAGTYEYKGFVEVQR
jgi:gliding motility-associated-like protein